MRRSNLQPAAREQQSLASRYPRPVPLTEFSALASFARYCAIRGYRSSEIAAPLLSPAVRDFARRSPAFETRSTGLLICALASSTYRSPSWRHVCPGSFSGIPPEFLIVRRRSSGVIAGSTDQLDNQRLPREVYRDQAWQRAAANRRIIVASCFDCLSTRTFISISCAQ